MARGAAGGARVPAREAPLVVDGITALVGSANITERAFHENLECGVLLRGGDAPREIRDHVLDLLHRGVLVEV